MDLKVTKRGPRGRFKPGTAPGPGRLPKGVTEAQEISRRIAARIVDGAGRVTPPSARDVHRLAGAVKYLCGELGFIRHRLVELEAHGRGIVARILALTESAGDGAKRGGSS
jgi:hypothetical protein